LSNVVEISIDGPCNRDLSFRPLQRTLRGTFDLNRIPEPLARMKIAEFPRPIPGLRIAVDGTTGIVTDPLHEPEHAAIREKIEAKGLKLGPHVERFQNIDANSWLFWMRLAVASGACKIVSGQFPAIDEAKARKDFVNSPPKANPRDSLIEKLVAVMYASLPPERRKEVAAIFED
jgi:hypothetical protein